MMADSELPAEESAASPSPPEDDPEDDATLHQLPLGIRIGLLVAGGFFLALGVVGLFLPVLQGFASLILGAAILSLVSEGIYELLRLSFHRWPRLWNPFRSLRRKIHRRLSRRHQPSDRPR